MEKKNPLIHSTERLELVSATVELLNAELESHEKLSEFLKAEIPGEWPPGEYDRNAIEFFRDQLLQKENELSGWLTWYVLKRSDGNSPNILIAAAGYMGYPTEKGEIEIGYSVARQQQNKGYAKEIVNALTDIACKDKRVLRIIARTKEENKSSRAVLENTGFRFVKVTEGNDVLYEQILK